MARLGVLNYLMMEKCKDYGGEGVCMGERESQREEREKEKWKEKVEETASYVVCEHILFSIPALFTL